MQLFTGGRTDDLIWPTAVFSNFLYRLLQWELLCRVPCKREVIIERVKVKAARITLTIASQYNMAMFSIRRPVLHLNSHRRRFASKSQCFNLSFVCELFKSDATHGVIDGKKGIQFIAATLKASTKFRLVFNYRKNEFLFTFSRFNGKWIIYCDR